MRILLRLATVLAVLAGPVIARADVNLPRSAVLNFGAPVFCVNPTTALPESCAGSGGGGGGSSSAVKSFVQTTTASAVVLPTNTLANGMVCQSLTGNSGTIYVGPATVTTANGYALIPGQAISWGVANSNQVYIVGTNLTDVISCTGN